MGFIRRFFADRRGGALIEYAAGLALTAAVISGAMTYFGMTVAAMLDGVAAALG